MSTLFRKTIAILIIASFVTMPTRAYALPTDGDIVGGTGSIVDDGTDMTITQDTARMAVDWDSFSIDTAESVNFVQPDASSIALNRVIGGSPSEILGQLSANGRVFLVNPNGILFGADSQVDTAGLLASTLDMDSEDFMDNETGAYSFVGNGGKVVNEGALNAPGGFVALMGAQVENSGAIVADLGTIALASGDAVTIGLDGQSLISVVIDQPVSDDEGEGEYEGAAVTNRITGTLQANGGKVILTADSLEGIFTHAINNEGIIEAEALEEAEGEVIINSPQDVYIGGSVSSDNIDVQGYDISLAGTLVATDAIFITAQNNITFMGGNVLQNGSFEDGLNGWTDSYRGNLATPGQDGTYSIDIIRWRWGYSYVEQRFGPVYASELSFWTVGYCENGYDSMVPYLIDMDGNYQGVVNLTGYNSGSWVEHTYDVSGYGLIQGFRMQGYNDIGDYSGMLVDNITLNAGSSSNGTLQAGNSVTMTARNGAIIDNSDSLTPDITTRVAILEAGTSIGSDARGGNGALDTNVDSLTAIANNGSVYINETNGVDLVDIQALGSTVNIVTNGDTIVENILAQGDGSEDPAIVLLDINGGNLAMNGGEIRAENLYGGAASVTITADGVSIVSVTDEETDAVTRSSISAASVGYGDAEVNVTAENGNIDVTASDVTAETEDGDATVLMNAYGSLVNYPEEVLVEGDGEPYYETVDNFVFEGGQVSLTDGSTVTAAVRSAPQEEVFFSVYDEEIATYNGNALVRLNNDSASGDEDAGYGAVTVDNSDVTASVVDAGTAYIYIGDSEDAADVNILNGSDILASIGYDAEPEPTTAEVDIVGNNIAINASTVTAETTNEDNYGHAVVNITAYQAEEGVGVDIDLVSTFVKASVAGFGEATVNLTDYAGNIFINDSDVLAEIGTGENASYGTAEININADVFPSYDETEELVDLGGTVDISNGSNVFAVVRNSPITLYDGDYEYLSSTEYSYARTYINNGDESEWGHGDVSVDGSDVAARVYDYGEAYVQIGEQGAADVEILNGSLILASIGYDNSGDTAEIDIYGNNITIDDSSVSAESTSTDPETYSHAQVNLNATNAYDPNMAGGFITIRNGSLVQANVAGDGEAGVDFNVWGCVGIGQEAPVNTITIADSSVVATVAESGRSTVNMKTYAGDIVVNNGEVRADLTDGRAKVVMNASGADIYEYITDGYDYGYWIVTGTLGGVINISNESNILAAVYNEPIMLQDGDFLYPSESQYGQASVYLNSSTCSNSNGNYGDVNITDSAVTAKVEDYGQAYVNIGDGEDDINISIILSDVLATIGFDQFVELPSEEATAKVYMQANNITINSSTVKAVTTNTDADKTALAVVDLVADGPDGIISINDSTVMADVAGFGEADIFMDGDGNEGIGRIDLSNSDILSSVLLGGEGAEIDLNAGAINLENGTFVTAYNGVGGLADVVMKAWQGSILGDTISLITADTTVLIAQNDIGTADAAINTDTNTLVAYSFSGSERREEKVLSISDEPVVLQEGSIFINNVSSDLLELGLYDPTLNYYGNIIAVGASVAANNGMISITTQGDMLVNSVVAPRGGVFLETAEGSIYAGTGWDVTNENHHCGFDRDFLNTLGHSQDMYVGDTAWATLLGEGDSTVDYFYPIVFTPGESEISGLVSGPNVIAGGYSYFSAPNGTIGAGNPGDVFDGLSGQIEGVVNPGTARATTLNPSVDIDLDRGTPRGAVYYDDGSGNKVVWPGAGLPGSNPLNVYINVLEGAPAAVPVGFIPMSGLTLRFSEGVSQDDPGQLALLLASNFRKYYELLSNFRLTSDPATPAGFYAYHPLVDSDLSGLGGDGLDAGAYEFIDGNISYGGDYDPFYDEGKKKKN